MKPTLYCIGMPLLESVPISPEAKSILSTAHIIVGESRKITDRFTKQANLLPNVQFYYLDPFRKEEWKAFENEVRNMRDNGVIALLSDTGMPILFDPGLEVLNLCRQHHFKIHSVAGPTSWGMAMALSGFPTPFLLEGFLPQDKREREKRLQELKKMKSSIVLLDTPYRFLSLLQQLNEHFKEREIFLAWEISTPNEKLVWSHTSDILQHCKNEKMEKGEFVIIVK